MLNAIAFDKSTALTLLLLNKTERAHVTRGDFAESHKSICKVIPAGDFQSKLFTLPRVVNWRLAVFKLANRGD